MVNKEKYIELIKKIEYKEPVKDVICNFIESYDGTNSADFEILLYTLISLLSDAAVKEIEAKGFQELTSDNEVVKAKLDEIKNNFTRIQKGLPPTTHEQING